MFDVNRFVEDCIQARAESDDHRAVREVVDRALSDPRAVMAGLGEPKEAGFTTLHRSDTLTILNFAWAPCMTLLPHNHNAWAVIGLYSGREDNVFWRKLPEGRIEAAGAKALMEGKAEALGRDIVHSVTNPLERMSCALQVYGGDFFADGRSEWDPESLQERPFDVVRAREAFARANARFASI